MSRRSSQPLLIQMKLLITWTVCRMVLIHGMPVPKHYTACWSNTSKKTVHHSHEHSRKTVCKRTPTEGKPKITWPLTNLLRFSIAPLSDPWSKATWLLGHQILNAPEQRTIVLFPSKILYEWETRRVVPGMKCLRRLEPLEIHWSH